MIPSFARAGLASWDRLRAGRPQTPRGEPNGPRHARARLRPRAALALLLVAVALVSSLAAPWLAPASPAAIDLEMRLRPPQAGHLAGTDLYGRDVLSRLLYGGRATLATALGAVSIAVVAGTGLGLFAGYWSGWLAMGAVAVIDLMLAFPALLLSLMVVALIGPGLPTLAIAVGISGVPTYARMARSVILSERNAQYVEAARAVGVPPIRILFRHLLPSLRTPLLALVTLDVGMAILHVAGLGFLGLGVTPPQAEWGMMLYEGREYLAVAPWTSVVPGLSITLTVLGTAWLGDELAESLTPHRY
jgi:peptide/nickel transport system permease protein